MRRTASFVSLSLLLVLASIVVSAAGESLDVTRWVVAGGGGHAVGGDYALDGTAGQPAVSMSSGGCYTLTGGYWEPARLVMGHWLHLPLLFR